MPKETVHVTPFQYETFKKLEHLQRVKQEDYNHGGLVGYTRYIKQQNEIGNVIDLKIDKRFRFGMYLVERALVQDLATDALPSGAIFEREAVSAK